VGLVSQYQGFAGKVRNFAMGAVPSLYLVDDVALTEICTALIKERLLAGNAELRFCTVASWCGYPPCGFSPPNGLYHVAILDQGTTEAKGHLPSGKACGEGVKEYTLAA